MHSLVKMSPDLKKARDIGVIGFAGAVMLRSLKDKDKKYI